MRHGNGAQGKLDTTPPLGLPSALMAKQPLMFCTRCHTVAEPETHTKGSFLLELALWICFLLPGIMYSIWRLTTRGKVCPSCGSYDLISPDSPLASQLRNGVNVAGS